MKNRVGGLHKIAAAIILPAIGVIFCVGHAKAETPWHVNDFRDPTNAELVRAATSSAPSGVTVNIFRSKDKVVRWVISLPSGAFDRLPSVGRVGAVRVDNSDVRDLEHTTSTVTEVPIIDARSIRGRLWHGEGPSPTRGTLRDILDGQVMTVRLFHEGGGHIDGVFTLESASSVISEALRIEAKADVGLVQSENARDDAILNATSMCASHAKLLDCTRALSECMSGDLSELTPLKLQQCMASVGFHYE